MEGRAAVLRRAAVETAFAAQALVHIADMLSAGADAPHASFAHSEVTVGGLACQMYIGPGGSRGFLPSTWAKIAERVAGGETGDIGVTLMCFTVLKEPRNSTPSLF